MEESFENYLHHSEEESFFSARGRSRYDDDRYSSSVTGNRQYDGYASSLAHTHEDSPMSEGMLRGGFSPGSQGSGLMGWQDSSHGYGAQGDEAYDFDINLAKKSSSRSSSAAKKKKKKKRDKEQEKLDKVRREAELKKSKEERMAELLGQISSEREKEREERAAEERRKKEEQETETNRLRMELEQLKQQQREEEERQKEKRRKSLEQESVYSIGSDSLDISQADFEVGGYKKGKHVQEDEEEEEENGQEGEDEDEDDNVDNETTDHHEPLETETLETIRKQLTSSLGDGVAPDELVKRFSFGDLSDLMKDSANLDDFEEDEYDDDDDEEVHKDAEYFEQETNEEENTKQAEEIFNSFQTEGQEEEEEEEEDQYDSEFDKESPRPPSDMLYPQVGARVRAKLFDWIQFYEGEIIRMDRDDGTLDLLFDDGDRVNNVDPSAVQVISAPQPPPESGELITKQQTRIPSPVVRREQSPSPTRATGEESVVRQMSPVKPKSPLKPTSPVRPMSPVISPKQHTSPTRKQKDEEEVVPRTPTRASARATMDYDDIDQDRIGRSPSPKNESRMQQDVKPKTQVERMRESLWGGVENNAVPSPPPPPPPPMKETPLQSKQVFSISKTATGKERLIKQSLVRHSSPPPPPPPSKQQEQKSLDAVLRKNQRVGGRFSMALDATVLKDEIAKLELQKRSLEAELVETERSLKADIKGLEETIESQEAEIFSLKAELKEARSNNALRISLQEIIDNGTISSDDLKRIDKELEEQDRLLQGYQKENEKLMEQLRTAEKRVEEERNKMYRANMQLGKDLNQDHERQVPADDLRRRLELEQAVEALKEEVSQLREDNNKKHAELEALRDAKKSPTEDVVNQLRKELAEARFEHLTEAKALKEKLEWYAENQELLDANEALIEEQKQRIRDLESAKNVAKRSQSLPSDLKRIRTLEKQVKELEEGLRKRNPDCLANLILAAGPTDSEKETRRQLREKVRTLQEELENREQRYTTRIRALRQEHERVKMQYEKQLEEKHHGGRQNEFDDIDETGTQHGAHLNQESKIKSLEQELSRVRDFYRKKIEDLTKKSSVALRAARRSGPVPTQEGSAQRDADKLRAAKVALEARVEELEMQLNDKPQQRKTGQHQQLQILKEENERLQNQIKELRAKRMEDKEKKIVVVQNHEEKEEKMLQSSGQWDSETFVDDEDMEILQPFFTNKNKEEEEEIVQPQDEHPPLSHRTTTQNNDDKRRIEEELKIANQKMKKRIEILERENEKVSERWEKALTRSEHVVKRLMAANAELEAQLTEAKHQLEVPATPSMLQHQQLVRRLNEMEAKFQARERELQLVVQQVQHRSELDLQTAQTKYETTLAAKNAEIMRFRQELDTLVETLKTLR